jgi:HSP20 family protein
MNPHITKLMQSVLSESTVYQESYWRPLADVYRCRDGWLVKFDLAGVRIEDIEVGAHGRHLTVRGVRRDCLTREGHLSYVMEIAYNRFQRVVELPCDIEQATIVTEYQDGMLLVRLALKRVPE